MTVFGVASISCLELILYVLLSDTSCCCPPLGVAVPTAKVGTVSTSLLPTVPRHLLAQLLFVSFKALQLT